jgi:hypothetical protein
MLTIEVRFSFSFPHPQDVRVDARPALSQALRAYKSKRSTANLWSYQGVIHQAGELNMQNPSQKRGEVSLLSHFREYGVGLRHTLLREILRWVTVGLARW